MRIDLPYGRQPYPLDLSGRTVRVLRPAALPQPAPLAQLLDTALRTPIGRPPLAVARDARVLVIVSDVTRDEPRAAFLAALARHLPPVRWTIAVATGSHGPCAVEALEIPPAVLENAMLVMHDGNHPDDLVMLGTTSRGTPVRVHPCLLNADLVIATGCIRPHYFAGFGAGVKAIFPGLGEATAIRKNHALKVSPGARAGIIEGNPCRADLEEAVALLATPTYLLNGVCGPDDQLHAAVAGDPVQAFRAGAALARPWFTLSTPPAALVIASDALPVSGSLYQAAKIAAAVAPIVAPNGTLAIVAECADGIEPIAVVNEAIFRIGVLPRLANNVRLALVSGLSRTTIERTLISFASSVDELVANSPPSDDIVVVPRASQLILETA